MKRKKKERNWGKVFTIAVLISFAAPIGFLIMRIISGEEAEGVGRGREDYILMLLQCLLGIAAILVPISLMRRWDVEIPRVMFLLYIGFLYCAIFLGACSGAMLGALGFSMIALLNNTQRIPMNLSPLFVSVFAFCFALALGAVWEIYEFSADALFGTNMQKFALDDGTQLVGQDALWDTMKDIIVDTGSALLMSVIGYISLKYKKGWVEKLMIRIGHRKNRREKPQEESA